jgi:hypothetical protein
MVNPEVLGWNPLHIEDLQHCELTQLSQQLADAAAKSMEMTEGAWKIYPFWGWAGHLRNGPVKIS